MEGEGETRRGISTCWKATLSGSGRGQPDRGCYKSGGICGINLTLERVIDSVEREGGKGSEDATARGGGGRGRESKRGGRQGRKRTRSALEGCVRTPSHKHKWETCWI